MDPATAVALWLLKEAIAPDAYTRLVETVRSKPQYKKLAREVNRDTGLRTGHSYKKWLRTESTIASLCARRTDAYDILVDSLAAAEAQGILRRRPENRERAANLVDSTIAFFLPTLDPSLATAIADERAEQRHAEVLGRLDSSTSFADRLESMPPGVRLILAEEQVHRGLAERLVDGIARGDPRSVISGWCETQPEWLVAAPAVILLALAHAAQAYGLRREAGGLYQSVAELGLDAPRSYARAAFEAAATDQTEQAATMLAKARALGTDSFVDMVAAAIDDDWTGILQSIERYEAANDAFVATLFASALQRSGDSDGAINFLVLVSDNHPEYSNVALQLASLLIERSANPHATSRQRDLQAALDLAVRARDARRQWRGNSRAAVKVACTAALLAGKFEEVVALGAAPPVGNALPEEADGPEVQFTVAQAAIAAGDHATAEHVANTASGFQQALIKADLTSASSAPQPDIDAEFREAWRLATTEEDRVAFWLSASHAGVEPLPGEDELSNRDDDLHLLCGAALHIAHARFAEAVALLRPLRQSESARRLLTDAYVRSGDVDAAVGELVDTAERFANVNHRVRAVELLVGAGRISEAAQHADKALQLLPLGRRERAFLHEVGVAAAHDRHDWPEMETRVRSWIEECGAERRRRWLLAVARFNQSDPEGAWRVLQEGAPPEPEGALEAQLWITLHARFRPSSSTLSEILALVDRFPGDPGIRATAVNAFFLMGDTKGEINDAEVSRWHALIRDRAENPDPEDTFISFSVPDDADGLIEAFRPLLEPHAQRMAEWLQKVRYEGWPYGALALAAGRSYTSALAHRAIGWLPIVSPDSTITEQERAAVRSALDGEVIADLSVLTTAWFVQGSWPTLLAHFERVLVTPQSRHDAAMTADRLQPRSNTNLSGDLETGRPVVSEVSDAELDRLEQHVAWVHEQVSTLSIRSVEMEGSELEGNDLGAWLSTVRAARFHGIPMWADDVGLRAVARNEGVPTFGTYALFLELESQNRVGADDVARAADRFREEYCVDLPLDPEWLITQAHISEFGPGPALFAFSRTALWRDLRVAYELWEQLATAAGLRDPALVPGWVFAASSGLARSVDEQQAVKLSAGVLVKAAGAVESNPTAFAACARAAATALSEKGLPDPTELALAMTMELLAQQVGPTKAATAVAQLGSELADEHRAALRRIIFGL